MDRRYLAGVLLAMSGIQSGRPYATRSAEVDAYYERHAAADRFAPRATLVAVTAVLGLVLTHWAALKNNVEAARLPIEAGIDVNATVKAGSQETTLHVAAERGSVEVATVPIEAGADPAPQLNIGVMNNVDGLAR